MSSPPLAPMAGTPKKQGWFPWMGLLGLTITLAGFSFARTEGTIFADAVEYLERAFAFARGETLVDAKQLRSAGITLIHLPALWLSQLLGVEETRWIIPYAAAIHVCITCLFVAATVHLGRSLAGFTGQGEDHARAVGWFAGILALGSPTLLQFSAVPMADIAAAAALAFGLQRAFLSPGSSRDGLTAGLGFGLAILAAYKTIPIVGVSVAMAFVLHWAAQRSSANQEQLDESTSGPRAAWGFPGAMALGLGGILVIQCWFDLATYGTFGVGLKNYVLMNAMPLVAYMSLKAGFEDLAIWAYKIATSAVEGSPQHEYSTNVSDAHQSHPATWYFDHFSHFMPSWLVPAFVLGAIVAAVRTMGTRSTSLVSRIARMAAANAPWLAAAALVLVTMNKGTKEMRIWLPILPAFAAYGAVGIGTLAGRRPFAGLRGIVVTCLLLVVPILGARTLTTYTSTAMGSLARAAEWLNHYGPLQTAHAQGQRPVVSASYHWSALFRTAPHLELLKLANQPDGSFAHLATPEERATTLAQIRALDAFIVHSSLLRIDAFQGAPEQAWAREIVDVLAEHFHVASAFWDRESDERRFGPILVLVRNIESDLDWRPLTAQSEADLRDDSQPLTRMERPLREIFEQVELEGARAWWLPGDELLWVELEFDQVGPEIIADYVMLLRATGIDSDQGAMAIRRPGWNKRRWPDLVQGARLKEGFILAPYQGSLSAADTSPKVAPGSPIRLWLDLATLDRDAAGQLYPTGRLEPLDPRWRGQDPGTVHAERDDMDAATGSTDDGHRFTGDFGHLLLGEAPAPGQEDDLKARGNVLRVEAGLQPR